METHYAKIEKGKVVNVEVVTDGFVQANPERYKKYVKIVGNAGRGYAYSGSLGSGSSGTFTPPKPYPSWILKNNKWEAHVKRPDGNYYWDEMTKDWIESELGANN